MGAEKQMCTLDMSFDELLNKNCGRITDQLEQWTTIRTWLLSTKLAVNRTVTLKRCRVLQDQRPSLSFSSLACLQKCLANPFKISLSIP